MAEKKKKEFIDSKEIEEKALNYFKLYLEDSQVVSQHLAENDKEPCWDGFLYVYEKGKKNKKTNLVGRIPVQVKGKEYVYIQKNCKYNIEIVDLKAYLHDPTIYVVCQIEKEGGGRKLFYRSLLPETVKHILQGKDKQKTVSIKMNAIPDKISDFEDELMSFIGNKHRQVGFADKKSMSMSEVIKRGIRQLSFVAPRMMNSFDLMNYLSKHSSYLYAKVDENLDLEVPIAEGPSSFAFESIINQPIRVDNRVFFDSCSSRIADGILTIRVGDFLTMSIPIDGGTGNFTIQTKSDTKSLDDLINEVAFILAVFETGKMNVGDFGIEINVNKDFQKAELEKRYETWSILKKEMNILHVTKQLILEDIKKEQEPWLQIFEECLIKKNTVSIPNQETSTVIVEFGNLRLLLCCIVNDGKCFFGDFFDENCVVNLIVEDESVEATVFSYLRNDNLWEIIDNINFEAIVPSYKALEGKHSHVFEIANQDVLAMIMAADKIERKDNVKTTKLLVKALEVNLWIENNDKEELKLIHHIDTLQIIKRQRAYKEEEKSDLANIMNNKNLAPDLRLVASMLLEDKEKYDQIPPEVDTEVFENIRKSTMKRFIME